MAELPNEVLVHILGKMPTDDLSRSKLVSRRMCLAANTVRKDRSRPLFSAIFSVDQETGETIVELQRRRRCNGKVHLLKDLDFEMWNLIEISYLELKGFSNSEILGYVNDVIELTGAGSAIEELRLTELDLDETSSKDLNDLYEQILPSCKHVSASKCRVPFCIPPHLIFSASKLQTIKWTECESGGEEDMAEAMMRRIHNELLKGTQPCHNVELEKVKYCVAVDVLEAWMTMANPLFFSLVMRDLSEGWRDAFITECARRGLNNFLMEFEHRTQNNAHIKVHFMDNCCRFFPVLDVPARSPLNPHINARWFRDWR